MTRSGIALILSLSWFGFGRLVDAQIIDTRFERANIALGADTDTNGALYSLDWTTDILVNGDRGDVIHGDGSGGVTGFPEEPGFSYTIDLGETVPLDGITLFPRLNCCPDRLRDFRVAVLDESNVEVWGVDLFPDSEAESPVELFAADGTGVFEGRYVTVITNQDPVDDYELQLAEIEVYSGDGGVEVPINYALGADAYTNGTIWSASWTPAVLTDGVANIIHGDGVGGTTGVAEDEGFYYEVDLGQEIEIAEIHLFPRQDGCCPERFTNYMISVHEDDGGEAGNEVWAAAFREDGSFPDTFDPDVVTGDSDPTGLFTGQWVRITSLATQDDIDDGFVDYRLQMSEIEVYGHVGTGLVGDFDESGELDVNDIDILSEEIRDGTTNLQFDLNDDGAVNGEDRTVWVEELKRTYFGDSNLDGVFDSSDFVTVFTIGEYEDGVALNSGWGDGDWDGNGDFDSSDFVAAFSGGGFEQGERGSVAAAVPEPSFGLFALVLAAICIRCRTK